MFLHHTVEEEILAENLLKNSYRLRATRKVLLQCGCGNEIKILTRHFSERPIPRFLPKHCWSYIGKLRKGKPRDEKTKKKLSEFKLKEYKNPNNHPRWKGGISFLPYPILFNKQLKERIRVRDNFICQLCGVPELELNQRLSIHHIDYDKRNCNENNLISLCRGCNSKANKKINGNNQYWINYFQNRILCR